MKNYIYTSLVFLFIGINAVGQSPDWTVNENNFEYTMSFVAFLNIDGNNLSSVNDKVAAFVDGELRGVANLTYVSNEDSYYAYLTVFSNADGETIDFKMYDSANNVVRDSEKTKTFEINAHYGNLFQAYSIASPALSHNADIIDFDFEGVTVNDMTILGNEITISLSITENVTALSPVFELSPEAKLFIGTLNQVSGENPLDFSDPIQFQVRSEDQSVLEQWTVTVKLGTGHATFYKKDAVCYTGGAIKVLFTENDVEAFLIKDEVTFATQTIHNGEAIFSNLEIGTYQVKVSGNNKEIIINQKE